jgi:hypothetical protein
MKIAVLTVALLAFIQTTDPGNKKKHSIPGRIECEYYSSYSDSDSINNGSGKLNPADGSFLNEFRMNEGVDISYTKEKNIDNTSYNKVQPLIGSLYVGWTVPGEWTKYDVEARESGTYNISLMYTAHDNGQIIIDIDGKAAIFGNVPSTFDAADTIAWRQWHHWNKVDLGEVKIKKGKHVLTLRTQSVGNMNYDFLDFQKKQW